MARPFLENVDFSANLAAQDWPAAAYVHIPFCRRRCFYCDFPISVVGDRLRGETSLGIQQYVDWLCAEIQATPSLGQPLNTIFFGGGTPSLLAAAQVEQIVETLATQFGLAANLEISMEMDPGTFTLAQVQAFRRAGINRASLGTQAFQDDLLEVCGRTHRVSDIYTAVDWVRQAGYDNVSLDLISGLPGQTLAQWQHSLEAVIALKPQHLSAYDLVLEPETAFGKRWAPGEGPLPTDELTAQMYRMASQMLQAAGYRHYEISNYALPGFECRHNLTYWRNEPYYGFGMGAASYLHGQRWSRPRTRVAYREWLDHYIQAAGHLDEGMGDEGDRLFETFMVGLRRAEGIELSQFAHQIDVEQVCRDLAPYVAEGWVALEGDRRLRLTDPEGFLFSNTVLVALWESLAAADRGNAQ
ncbi:MAG TPA: radical SAM family heme chaperone HemW [Stenomitos sp.]